MARVTEETIAGSLRGLSVGQSFSRTKRIPVTDLSKTTISAELQKLRNLMNQAVGKTRNELPGTNFRVESASGLTSDNQCILATVAATRLDGGAEADDEEMDI